MPELPDVEVFGRRLARRALHHRIGDVDVRDAQVLDHVSRRRLEAALRGHRLARTRRHGKHLLVEIAEGGWLTLHFGMTAYVDVGAADVEPPPHARVVLALGGERLCFVDQRRLGRLGLTDDPEAFIADHDLGPDALRLDLRGWREVLRGSRATVVATLMDQRRVAGIGNLYSDEILFHARLDPRRAARSLVEDDEPGVRRLHRQTQRVLRRAIEAGADPARMPRGWLLHRREDGQPCPRCGGEVARLDVGGRHSYWCPGCQAA